MHRRAPLSLLVCGPALAGLALAGCSSAVRVTPFEGSATPQCQAVARAWPLTVGGQEPRVTAVQDVTVAAWGDPPIIARCGKLPPGPTTDPCIDADGVDWVAVPREGGTEFTTYGRSPALEVLVPDDYATAPLLLPAFAEAARTVEQDPEARCS